MSMGILKIFLPSEKWYFLKIRLPNSRFFGGVSLSNFYTNVRLSKF